MSHEQQKRKTIEHTVSVKIVENVPKALYLRQELVTGTAGGMELEISTTGGVIIVDVGKFEEGRQFMINVVDLARVIIDALMPELATENT